MKLTWTTLLLLLSTGVISLSIPPTDSVQHDADTVSEGPLEVDLEKRRGGGGGGGARGGSSGGGGGGRSSSSGSRGSSSGRTSSSSNSGGTSSRGSSVQPAYGGGRYYAGGASAPYAAGRRSPLGVTPFLLPAAALAFFPGIWLYGAYAYPYSHGYHFRNDTSHKNESVPITCVCQEYSECGCDNNNNQTYYESLFNGTAPRNTSNIHVVTENGTNKIYINGTLPNGTTVADSDASVSGAAPLVTLLHASGYWVTVALVVMAVQTI
ncbi:hypothetical protein NUU61_005627 [Penicillium alfredii]|uniref:DUF7732 domain-containing protein n=1 Tax=Penicillium alfredii TaxID=1506179 RepID=A0A9W9K8D6_9EURO|nr:uncharacterized protein NUU61_005627 [Penicillium alfredii]KAJ5096271.1 hypothetical protein NUU61_005627 [Penicillium alfredii]